MARRVSVLRGHVAADVAAARPVAAELQKGAEAAGGRFGGDTLWSPGASALGGGGTLKGRTLFITGASRGIGLAIALRAARDGANIVIAAKTAEAHPTLPGTIHSAAEEVRSAGGRALPCVVDVRDEDSIAAAVRAAVAEFGGIDVLINCASAIFPAPTEKLDLKRLDLMWHVTTRGPLLCAKHCVPWLKKSAAAGRNPHIINCSPPVDFHGKWAEPSQPNYMVCKMGMTTGAMALGKELRSAGVAANTLWPAGAITTSAINHLVGNDPAKIDAMYMRMGRVPAIQADAAYAILTSKSASFTMNQCIDEDVVVRAGCTDLGVYDYARSGATRAERLRRIIRT